MKRNSLLIGLLLALALAPSTAHAYVGPGAGLSAFGALLALVGSVVAAVFGFVWYPIKRLIRAVKRRRESRKSVPADSLTS
jgi:hypothetical protein